MARDASQILVRGEGLIEEEQLAEELSLVKLVRGRGRRRLDESVGEGGIDVGVDLPDVGIFMRPSGQVSRNINVAGTEL